MNIAIVGTSGRMVKALHACTPHRADFRVCGAIRVNDVAHQEAIEDSLRSADVVIDFSAHTITVAVVNLCMKFNKPLVIGTTGHSEEERQEILRHAQTIPIVMASNFSTGVNTLFWLTRKATEILGPDFDLEVVEMHHRLKKDAPSGTAVALAKILANVRKVQVTEAVRHGRSGFVGERSAEEIGMHALRGGDVVGDHTVVFAGPGERVELVHKATNREVFANGALRAAQWVVGKEPGLYSMQDVLGLR